MQKTQFLSLPLLPWMSAFLIALLAACSPETSETLDVNETLASEQGATLDPNDVAEALVVSTTHWLNDAPIGNGMGAVTTELLSQPQSDNPEHWLQYGGDYSNNRHSPITELSPENVDQLQYAWGFPTGTTGQFATSPVVYDGIMYVTSSYNRLFALDAATGQLYWRYDHPQPGDLRIC